MSPAKPKPKILVIEDEAGIRALIQRALEGSYDVRQASDGTEGVKLARWEKPDLILLDLRMPGISGIEVLAQLKANKDTSGIPVVIVSGKGDTDALLHGQRAGAIDHIIKPFEIPTLLKVVQHYLPW